jgi:DNA-binding XRE family transcriptional regulator
LFLLFFFVSPVCGYGQGFALPVPYYFNLILMDRINRIKEVLVIKGFTQVFLANEIGKSTTAITSMCNNKSQPHLKDLKRIAYILDVDIRDLLVSTKK